MKTETFGNRLFDKVHTVKGVLFMQGEFTQLTYQAFDKYVEYIKQSNETEIALTYPIGITPDDKPIFSTYKYSKIDLYKRYQYLGFTQLPINGIYQLVTLMESLLVDILREILLEFPDKISSKRKFDYELISNATSLEQIKLFVINSVLNELTYKSPKDFAEEFKNFVGIDFLAKPVFHNYIELKATRDIHIHNQGIANEIYLSKSGKNARVKSGETLAVDTIYFLKSYEWCIQIANILEKELNDIWPSSDYEERQRLIYDENKSREEKIIEAEMIEQKKKKEKVNLKR